MASGGDSANPSQYGGKILTKKSRDRIDQQSKKVMNQDKYVPPGATTSIRDEKGRIMFTKNERKLMARLAEYKNNNLIQHPIVPQFEVDLGGQPLLLDFAIPNLKIGIEADGEAFHSSPEQIESDNKRDGKLSAGGWTIFRFTDEEIDRRLEQVMSTIVKAIMQRELSIKNLQKETPETSS